MTIGLDVRSAGKRYRRGWALRDCDLSVAPSSITALVGPNGAGKSTLMAAAAGLISLTEGVVSVAGRIVDRAMDPAVGYLAQDKPLYRRWTVGDMVAQTRDLNVRFDHAHARRLVEGARLPLDAKVGTLSGGQRARLALILVLGRRPALAILDEPLAELDPLARLQVQQLLMAEVADTGMTVLLSSHILVEVQDTCDALVLLQDGRVGLHDRIDDLVSRHRMLTGPAHDPLDWLPSTDRVEVRTNVRQTTVLVTNPPPVLPTGWTEGPADLEEIVIARMRAVEESDNGGTGRAA